MRKKRVVYLGFVIAEENEHVDIYKYGRCISSVQGKWESGVKAAKSKIDKVVGFRFDTCTK